MSTAAGLSGAIFYVVHHITIQTTLFLVAGLVEERAGSTDLRRIGGLAWRRCSACCSSYRP
ncbi:proton-conducting transporter membrane subunit [Micromonospora sp. M12]